MQEMQTANAIQICNNSIKTTFHALYGCNLTHLIMAAVIALLCAIQNITLKCTFYICLSNNIKTKGTQKAPPSTGLEGEVLNDAQENKWFKHHVIFHQKTI